MIFVSSPTSVGFIKKDLQTQVVAQFLSRKKYKSICELLRKENNCLPRRKLIWNSEPLKKNQSHLGSNGCNSMA